MNALLRQSGASHLSPQSIAPTKGFAVEQLQWEGRRVTLWDVSGEPDYRGIWDSYLPRAAAVVLVIDGSDAAPETLNDLIDVCARLRAAGRPFAVLFAKSDLPGFSMLPFTDLLRREGLFPAVRAVQEAWAGEADLLPKVLALLIA